MENGVFRQIQKKARHKMGAHFETQLYINYIYKIAQYTIKRVNSVLEYSIFLKRNKTSHLHPC